MSQDRPAHYGGPDDPYECVKVAEAWYGYADVVAFCKISALKYLQRGGKKPGASHVADLIKAKTYLEIALERLPKPTDSR